MTWNRQDHKLLRRSAGSTRSESRSQRTTKKKETKLRGSKDDRILPIGLIFLSDQTRGEDSSSRCRSGGRHTREFYLPKWNYSPEKVRADVADGGQRQAGDRDSSRREDRHGAGPPSCGSSFLLGTILGSILIYFDTRWPIKLRRKQAGESRESTHLDRVEGTLKSLSWFVLFVSCFFFFFFFSKKLERRGEVWRWSKASEEAWGRSLVTVMNIGLIRCNSRDR